MSAHSFHKLRTSLSDVGEILAPLGLAVVKRVFFFVKKKEIGGIPRLRVLGPSEMKSIACTTTIV
jgi:hypothetical protein